MKWPMIGAWIFCSMAMGGSFERLNLTPLDLKGDNNDLFPRSITQIYSHGNRVYVRSNRESFVVLVDEDGWIRGTLGRAGGGPGEFRGGLMAAAAAGDKVIALSSGHTDRFSLFMGDGYAHSFPIVSPIFLSLTTSATNACAFNGETVVFPTHPQSGYLAYAYALDGAKRPVGSLIFDKRDAARLEENPYLNDTLWTYGEPYWYAVMRYVPLVLKFDASFELVASFQLKSDRLEALREEVQSHDPKRFTVPPPLFRDLQVRDGSLYALAPRTLFEIDIESGVIVKSYGFEGGDSSFPKVTRDQELNFCTFAILDDGRVWLGPAFIWGHDLVTTRLTEHRPVSKETKGATP